MNYLIIANGASVSEALLKSEIKSAEKIILLDGAFNNFPDTHSFDFLLGDFDSLIEDTESEQQFERIHAPDQNKTDLEKAFDYLIERNIPAVNVVWATGKRADHTITNITNITRYRDRLKIVILDDHSKVFLLPKKFEKWYPANTPLSLIPIGTVAKIYSQNLYYPLENDTLTIGYRSGSSNHVKEDGLVVIKHEKGDLLLMECWD